MRTMRTTFVIISVLDSLQTRLVVSRIIIVIVMSWLEGLETAREWSLSGSLISFTYALM